MIRSVKPRHVGGLPSTVPAAPEETNRQCTLPASNTLVVSRVPV